MAHVVGVKVRDSQGCLPEVPDGFGLVKLPVLSDHMKQISFVGVFHQQEYVIFELKEVVKFDDVGMIQFLVQLDLALDDFELDQSRSYSLFFASAAVGLFIEVQFLQGIQLAGSFEFDQSHLGIGPLTEDLFAAINGL